MKKLRITIGAKTYDVTVEVLQDDQAARPVVVMPTPAQSGPPPSQQPPPGAATPVAQAEAGAVVSPMAGTVKSVAVKEDDTVAKGQLLAVLDAMKMENHVVAPWNGTVKSVAVQAGDTVHEGQSLLVIE